VESGRRVHSMFKLHSSSETARSIETLMEFPSNPWCWPVERESSWVEPLVKRASHIQELSIDIVPAEIPLTNTVLPTVTTLNLQHSYTLPDFSAAVQKRTFPGLENLVLPFEVQGLTSVKADHLRSLLSNSNPPNISYQRSHSEGSTSQSSLKSLCMDAAIASPPPTKAA